MCLQTPAPYPEHTHLLNTGPRQVQEGDVMNKDQVCTELPNGGH